MSPVKGLIHLGTARSIASSKRFSSLPLGYRADKAFARRKKSGLRSCSALMSARRAFDCPPACNSIAACTRSTRLPRTDARRHRTCPPHGFGRRARYPCDRNGRREPALQQHSLPPAGHSPTAENSVSPAEDIITVSFRLFNAFLSRSCCRLMRCFSRAAVSLVSRPENRDRLCGFGRCVTVGAPTGC